MGRPFGKIAWTPETLATRVCRNSHIGQWVVRTSGAIACTECQSEAQKRYRSGTRDHETRTYTRSDSLAVLEATEKKLEDSLEAIRKKLEIVRKMKELREQLDTLD
jgi:hypothetical protein